MARSKQPLPTTVTTASGVAAAPTGDIAQLVEDLDAMLTRLARVPGVGVIPWGPQPWRSRG